MRVARNIVYSYVDPRQPDEFAVDLTGEVSFRKGDVLTHNGKLWKVESVHLEAKDGDLSDIPTLWVLLIEALVN